MKKNFFCIVSMLFIGLMMTSCDNDLLSVINKILNQHEGSKEITAFIFQDSKNGNRFGMDIYGIINGTNISLSTPYNVSLANLVATVSHTGDSISPDPASAFTFISGVQNFYTITALNGTKQVYTVTVTIMPAAAKDILSMTFYQSDNPDLPDDWVNNPISGTTITFPSFPAGTVITGLVPTIVISGTSVTPPSRTANDFSGGSQSYTITAGDSSTKIYSVIVGVAGDSTKEISSFKIKLSDNSGSGLTGDVTCGITGIAITCDVPFGVNTTALVPTIVIAGASVSPESGIAYSFTDGIPQAYRVTAVDNTFVDYDVTVSIALNPAKALTSFIFKTSDNSAKNIVSDAIGTINEALHTVSVTVPWDTVFTGLKPTIVITGASVSPASLSPQDFTNGVAKTYTVTAEDSTTQEYAVTVTREPSPNKDITSFILAGVTGSIAGTTITLTYGSCVDLSAAIATFTTTGQTVMVAGVEQQSGVTPNYFGGTVNYMVTAEDLTTKTYTVTTTLPCWAYTYYGATSDSISSIAKTNDGNVLISGVTTSFGATNEDYWIVKISNTGSILWQKRFHCVSHDSLYMVLQGTDGNYYLSGTLDRSTTGRDIWILKMDPNGNVLWQKRYGGFDGDDNNFTRSGYPTSDGGLLVGGSSKSYRFLGNTSTGGWMFKLDSAGVITWQKYFGLNPELNLWHNLANARPISGGYVGVGRMGNTVGFSMIKVDTNATSILWAKTFGSASTEGGVSDVLPTNDGGYIVAGPTTGYGPSNPGYLNNILLVKFDTNGNIVWQKVYGGLYNDYVSALTELGDGSIMVAGSTYSFNDGSIQNAFLMKLGSDGQIIWQRRYAGESHTAGNMVKDSGDGYFYLGGMYYIGAVPHPMLMRFPDTGNDFGIPLSLTVANMSLSVSSQSVQFANSSSSNNNTASTGVTTSATVTKVR